MEVWPVIVRSRKPDPSDNRTFGQRAADWLTNGMGSWRFLIEFLCFLGLWMAFNSLFQRWTFDKYPFVFLNLILSCLAAVQAPVIMMSQTRKDEISSAVDQSDLESDLEDLKIDKDTNARVQMLQDMIKEQGAQISRLEAQLKQMGDRLWPSTPTPPQLPS